MALKITPRLNLDNMVKGEEISFTLDVTDELDSNTVASHTFKIYNSSGVDFTSYFSGDSSETDGVITFGVIAYDVGNYKIKFWVTCNEFLPDGTTPYEFVVVMTMKILA